MTNQTSTRATRDQRRQRKQQQEQKSRIISGLLIAAVLSLIGYLVWNGLSNPPLGDAIPVTGEGVHVPNGNPLPQYATDPPTSGGHYETALPAGFYDTTSPEATTLPNPQGFIVHSLEHGYVVFWYNCALLASDAECETLKASLQATMATYNNFKIIAFPWASTDVPVVATSWGRMLKFEAWDAELAAQFIERNRNHAPENQAP